MASPIENEVFVNLIGNRNHVMFDAQVSDDGKFLLGEYPARWIVRRIEEHRLGLLLKRAFQLFRIEPVLRRTQRNPDGNASGERNARVIVFVGWLEHHDFVARIYDA